MKISSERKIYNEIQKYFEHSLKLWDKTETNAKEYVAGRKDAIIAMKDFLDKEIFKSYLDEWREEAELEKVYNGEYVEGWIVA